MLVFGPEFKLLCVAFSYGASVGKTLSLTLYIIFFYHSYLSQLSWRGGKIVDLCPEVLRLKVRTPATAYFFYF